MAKFDEDIANIAMSIMEGPQTPTQSATITDNIHNIKVPDSFVNSIAEGVAPKVEEEEVITEVSRDPNDLLKEFQELITKGKGLINEMTTAGMIGCGPVKAIKPKPKAKKKKVTESINELDIDAILKSMGA